VAMCKYKIEVKSLSPEVVKKNMGPCGSCESCKEGSLQAYRNRHNLGINLEVHCEIAEKRVFTVHNVQNPKDCPVKKKALARKQHLERKPAGNGRKTPMSP
jgi:threonine dehydrogenase-like Zn-dependent dehydrogenase